MPDLMARARDLLRERLSEESFAHCERVSETARELARAHGVDPHDAALAGLLHDYSRDETDRELLESAEAFGLSVLPLERGYPYLLHARVAAARLRRELPDVPEEVLSAIAVHTVGAAPMSDLEKIVFLADMIEPERTWEGVDALRATCAGEDLGECFREGFRHTIESVMRKGHEIHPVAFAVMHELAAEQGSPFTVSAGGEQVTAR